MLTVLISFMQELSLILNNPSNYPVCFIGFYLVCVCVCVCVFVCVYLKNVSLAVAPIIDENQLHQSLGLQLGFWNIFDIHCCEHSFCDS